MKKEHPIIEIDKLQKTYYDEGVATHALKSATFSINKGEFVAIMGPSGSGKSTLLHVLGLLDRPTGGKFLFRGKDMLTISDEDVARLRNREIGFVFQAFNLLARTTVLENVKLPLLYSSVAEGEWDERAREAIKSVGLEHRMSHEPSQLSGGEKQRVAIARALVTRPEVIFADEPTGNLDSVSGKVVMGLVQRLNEKEGKTVVLITHEHTTAQHAERIIRLKDGIIASDDKVSHRKTSEDEFLK